MKNFYLTTGIIFHSFSLSLVQFRCCGVTNHTDWFEVYNTTRVPDSCCLEYSDNCGLDNPGTWWTAVSFDMNIYLRELLLSFLLSCIVFRKDLPLAKHFSQTACSLQLVTLQTCKGVWRWLQYETLHKLNYHMTKKKATSYCAPPFYYYIVYCTSFTKTNVDWLLLRGSQY